MQENILQYCKGLITSLENNPALVEQYFYSALQGDNDLTHHTLQPEEFICWKRHLQKDSLQPHWKGPYQGLLTNTCANKLQGVDSWFHVFHLKAWLDLHTNCDLILKISRNWSRQHLKQTAFPRWQDKAWMISPLCFFAPCFPLLYPGEMMPSFTFPNPLQEGKPFLVVGSVFRNLDLSMTAMTL